MLSLRPRGGLRRLRELPGKMLSNSIEGRRGTLEGWLMARRVKAKESKERSRSM